MGAYSYCHKCDAGQAAPEVEDFSYGPPSCDTCGTERQLPENTYREVVAARFAVLEEKIAALEAALMELTNRNKDDGK